MELTVVIPFREGYDTIQSLLSSIPSRFPVIIVDDVSSAPLAINRDNTQVVRMKKRGYFSGAVNYGITLCDTNVLILNQDIEFKGSKAFELIEHYQSEYAIFGESISGSHPAWSTGYVHGTFMFLRRDAIREIGLLNEEFYPLWGSTCEWQLRACRKGFRALPLPSIAGMKHKRNGAFGSSIKQLLEEQPESKERFLRTPPLVSVIVPAYNHGKFLPELINSLIGGHTSLGEMPGQTFQSFDVIVADDCSTDNTEQVMQELADPWKGIKYVRTVQNSGTSAACNLAIAQSTAKYIARIDADDMRESESIENMLRLQLSNPHSFIYDDVQLFSEGVRMPKPWKMREYDFDELIVKNFIHAGIMFPKKAWEDAGRYPEEMRWGRDDWAFNIALGLKGWCGIHLSTPGYLYRRHSNNRTIKNTNSRDREKFKQQIMTLYPDAYKEIRPMSCCGSGRSSRLRSQTYARANGGGTAKMSLPPGSAGLVLIEYQGLNYGDETYFGAVTGASYTFSAKNKRKWVDPKDLHVETSSGQDVGLLDLVRNNKPIFKLFRQPIAEATQKAATIAEEMASQIVTDFSDEFNEVVEAPANDYFVSLKGVGLATSKKLITNGYYSMQQLSEADTDSLMEIMSWTADKAIDIQRQAGESIG